MHLGQVRPTSVTPRSKTILLALALCDAAMSRGDETMNPSPNSEVRPRVGNSEKLCPIRPNGHPGRSDLTRLILTAHCDQSLPVTLVAEPVSQAALHRHAGGRSCGSMNLRALACAMYVRGQFHYVPLRMHEGRDQ